MQLRLGMEAKEFFGAWHASFGKAQPPEWVSKLSAQDVGRELKSSETRVQTLREQLKQEEFVLDWLRRVVAQCPSCEGETSERCHLTNGEGREEGSKALRSPGESVSVEEAIVKEEEEAAGDASERERGNSESILASASSSVESHTSVEERSWSRDDTESHGTREKLSAQSEDTSAAATADAVNCGTSKVGESEANKQDGERETVEVKWNQVRERFVHKVDSSDRRIAKAVKKRLIEQGKWWSTNLLSLDPASHTHSPACRKRSVSEPVEYHPQLTTTFSPEYKPVASTKTEVSEIPQFVSVRVEQPQAVQVNGFKSRESVPVFETHHRALNEPEEKKVNRSALQKKGSKKENTLLEKSSTLEVEGPNSKQSRDKENIKGRSQPDLPTVLPIERSNSDNSKGSVHSSLEEERVNFKPEQRKSTIEAKLEERRKSGGWKIVEVGRQRKSFKSKTLERNFPRNRTASKQEQMLKAAKETLTRVTSSPPLRRRASREKEKRRSPNQHRASNGKVEAAPAVVKEVMVEKRLEKSESLLSEIMAHRFSNGLDGAQLLESGEHSITSSHEEGTGKLQTKSENVPPPEQPTQAHAMGGSPKVILRRRSERDVDPLPEAKRRSSYLEDDDCSTPKEDISVDTVFTEEAMQQGLTKGMVEAMSISKPQVSRMDSTSTLRQESLESTITPTSSLSLPGNVNYRMSYMTAVRESPQINLMPQIEERDSSTQGTQGRLKVVVSEPNLLEMELTTNYLEDSMELDEATISAVTLNNEMFGSRSNSVTSLPETLDDAQSSSASSLPDTFSSPHHQVVNLRSANNVGRRKNRKRMGNAELDQTGVSLEEMLSSEAIVSPNNTMSSRSSLSPVSESSVPMSPSPSITPPLTSPTREPEVSDCVYKYVCAAHPRVCTSLYNVL